MNKINFPLEQPVVAYTGDKRERELFTPVFLLLALGSDLDSWELTSAGIQWGNLSKQIVFSS